MDTCSKIECIQRYINSKSFYFTYIFEKIKKNVVTERSTQNGTFKCDRGGVYINRKRREPIDRERKKSRRKNDCSFRCRAQQVTVNNILKWYIVVKCAKHNHVASLDPAGHLYLRCLTDANMCEDARLLTKQSLFSVGINHPIITKDVANIQNGIRFDFLNGRSYFQALFDTLFSGNIYY